MVFETQEDNGELLSTDVQISFDADKAENAKVMHHEETIEGNDCTDDENLPPFELPSTYQDSDNRESLSESSAYAEHLNEHWGF